jgi:hypothetical protein
MRKHGVGGNLGLTDFLAMSAQAAIAERGRRFLTTFISRSVREAIYPRCMILIPEINQEI